MSSIKPGTCLFALASMLLASACTGMSTKRSDVSGSVPTVAASGVSPPNSAEQIANRFLAWLAHVETPKDLSASAVQRSMGVRMQADASDSSRFEATGPLAGEWRYSLATVPSSYGVAPHALRLRFDDGRDGTSDMSPICRFDYAQYKASLEHAGFDPRVIAGNTRQVDFNHDSGSGLHVTVYIRPETSGNPQKYCVDMALIDFMPGSPRTPHTQ